jgi:hypothetical protein
MSQSTLVLLLKAGARKKVPNVAFAVMLYEISAPKRLSAENLLGHYELSSDKNVGFSLETKERFASFLHAAISGPGAFRGSAETGAGGVRSLLVSILLNGGFGYENYLRFCPPFGGRPLALTASSTSWMPRSTPEQRTTTRPAMSSA